MSDRIQIEIINSESSDVSVDGINQPGGQAQLNEKSGKEGFQQHCVRFRQLDDFLNPGQNVLELLLFNSHDRSKKFSISAGIYRFVCANGLVIADSVFESYDIKHIGDKENEVKNAVDNIVKAKEKIMDKITLFENKLC